MFFLFQWNVNDPVKFTASLIPLSEGMETRPVAVLLSGAGQDYRLLTCGGYVIFCHLSMT